MPDQNQLRIIGGRWRRHWLRFTAIGELRPTPDAVRETLFNWLQSSIEGTRCLDLFAGSGALGLEAVSRGAREAVLVERSQVVVQSLLANVNRLQAGNLVRVVHAEAQRFLARKPEPFDLVFLDPPFKSMLAERISQQLDSGGWLTNGALIYLETDSHCSLGSLPNGWRPLRAGVAGAVCYRLLRYEAATRAGNG